jgi:hypothetical protein
MTAVAGYKKIGAPFSDEVQTIRARYSFSADGGATGALDLFQAVSACVVVGFYAVVQTTATSGGSATVKVGVTGDDDHFVKTTEGAVANLTANALFSAKPELTEGTPNTIAMMVPVRLAAGDSVLMTIGTAALTAGVIDFVVQVAKA